MTAQLNDWQRLLSQGLGPYLDDAVSHGTMRRNKLVCYVNMPNDARQALVEMLYTRKIVQDALIDSQWAEDQRAA